MVTVWNAELSVVFHFYLVSDKPKRVKVSMGIRSNQPTFSCSAHNILATRVNIIGSSQNEYQMKALCLGYTKVSKDLSLKFTRKKLRPNFFDFCLFIRFFFFVFDLI